MAFSAARNRRLVGLAQAAARRRRVGASPRRAQSRIKAADRIARVSGLTGAGRVRRNWKETWPVIYPKRRRVARAVKRNPKRKVKKMARRRTAAQRAAFRKMVAGLKRYKSKRRRARAPKVRRVKARRRRAVSARRSPKGALNMAVRRRKRRRRNAAALVNPRRRRRRRSSGRRVRARRRRNPSFRRRRYRRNPGGSIMAAVKTTVKTAIPALLAGGFLGVLDVKVLTNYSPMVRIGAKVVAAAVAGVALRKSPNSAYAAMGAILGSLGYEQAAKMAGGAVVVAGNTQTASKQLSMLIREDPAAMGPVVDDMRGMGLLIEVPGGASNGVGQQDASFFG